MSVDLTIDAGLTAGKGGNPLQLELKSLFIDNEDKFIDVKFYEQTIVGGEAGYKKLYSYRLKDGMPHVLKDGEAVQAKDDEGVLLFDTIQRQVTIDGVHQFNQDGTPILEDVQVPRALLAQFTRWVTAMKPYVWDATGALKDGIKQFYKLV
jgi:hypothetical protein